MDWDRIHCDGSQQAAHSTGKAWRIRGSASLGGENENSLFVETAPWDKRLLYPFGRIFVREERSLYRQPRDHAHGAQECLAQKRLFRKSFQANVPWLSGSASANAACLCVVSLFSLGHAVHPRLVLPNVCLMCLAQK